MDVLSSNITTYCHISLPYITSFSINANHKKCQTTLLHYAMCLTLCHVSVLPELDQCLAEAM